MACIMCGKEGPADDSGLCERCADKLKQLSGSSAGLLSVGPDALAQAKPSEAEDGDNGARGDAQAHLYESTSRIVFELGQSEAFKLRNPFSVETDPSENILVMDRPERGLYRVSLFSPDGQYQRTVLECQQGDAPDQLKHPKGIATDRNGNIYIPDAGNNRIQRFDGQGGSLGAIGRAGDAPGEFSYPCDVAVDDIGSLYVADTYNGRIQKLTPQGAVLMVIGHAPNGTETDAEQPPSDVLDEPLGVCVDADRNVFVTDTNHHRVVKFDPNGSPLLVFGTPPDGDADALRPGTLSYPCDIRVDDDAIIYVADNDNARVQKFDPRGTLLAVFAVHDVAPGSRTGGDVAIDAEGCLLIANATAHTVAKVELLDLSAPGEPGPDLQQEA